VRRFLCVVVLVGSFWLLLMPEALARQKQLQIYFIDVEGGQSTLIVSPSGQSILVDAGWADFKGRDADRIVAAAKAAKVKRIDYLVITHYHGDHVGGVRQLAERMKIGTFVDHGPNQENSDNTRKNYEAYQQVMKHAAHAVVRPGDGLPVKGITVEVLTAAGGHLGRPLPGAGETNPYCYAETEPPVDTSENAQSLGLLITYGRFHFLDMGDLSKRKELELMCPNNPIGTVDLFLVSHHGMDSSNSKSLVWAVHPRVAIMNNGAHKGGSPAAWQIVQDSPGLEDLWQLHYAVAGGQEHNVAEKFIANPEEKADAGDYIKVTAEPDGTFTVLNERNGYRKTYGKED
jgi:competence protein ComEC